jgi:hypothetical protein
MIGQPRGDLTDHGHLLVRRAVLRDDWISEEILELAANGQREWTVAEWSDLLAELKASKMRLRDWLVLYT